MVKECIVKINNDVVTVVTYGDIDVQFPSIHKDAKTLFIDYENGRYTIVDKDYKPNDATVEKKSTKKKTTNKEIAKKSEVMTEDNEDA